MKIIQKQSSSVEIEDEGRNRSTVFLGDDKRWKCLRCQRYTCQHVKFVQQVNPTLPPAATELTYEDIADLIDD